MACSAWARGHVAKIFDGRVAGLSITRAMYALDVFDMAGYEDDVYMEG